MSLELTWLQQEDDFPPTRHALEEPNGLLAVGGDLSPSRLLSAYRRGIFPWFEPGQPILWWTPDPRMVLFPGECHVSRSLRKVLRQNRFQLSVDQAFDRVVSACAGPRRATHGTWITDEMRYAYGQLHQRGHAHSVEVWQDNQLVGGLYGVALGAIFFGESMFSHATDASKVAFVSLAAKLNDWGYKLLDCQVASDHLFTLGAREIPRAEFETILSESVCTTMSPQIWQNGW